MDKRGLVEKYASGYMCIGSLFGLMLSALFETNKFVVMCVGMCIGYGLGAARDKRLSKKMMIITGIEDIDDSSDIMIHTIDKNGIEKEYRVAGKKEKEEKFIVDGRVAEETNGSLVSLESYMISDLFKTGNRN